MNKNDHKSKKNQKNITESITMVRFWLILQSSDRLKVLGPYGDPMLSMRYSGGSKVAKNEAKTLNNVVTYIFGENPE